MFENSPHPDLLIAVDRDPDGLCAAIMHRVTRSVVATIKGEVLEYHCAKTPGMEKAIDEAIQPYRARLAYEETKI